MTTVTPINLHVNNNMKMMGKIKAKNTRQMRGKEEVREYTMRRDLQENATSRPRKKRCTNGNLRAVQVLSRPCLMKILMNSFY